MQKCKNAKLQKLENMQNIQHMENMQNMHNYTKRLLGGGRRRAATYANPATDVPLLQEK